nr:hypothetical protein [Streptomyces sp. DSM 41633]
MTPFPVDVMRQTRPHDGLPPGSVRHPDTPGAGAQTAAPGQRTRRQQPAA